MKRSNVFISKHYLKMLGLLCFLILFSSFIRIQTPHKKTESTTHTVTIFRMKFNPENLEVKKGDTVIWVNKDFVPHDVTEEINNTWTSKPINQGDKWEKVIQDDVHYYCSIHKVMKGTITVTE